MSRTIIIGDVHGMLCELRGLLSRCSITQDDHIVFVGDLVDKGPDSAGVVSYVRGLRESGFDIVLVLGNHEHKHARYRAYEARRASTGATNPMTKGLEELAHITAALSEADVAFLDTAVLYHVLPEHNALVVHAGVAPSIDSLPPVEQVASMSRKHRDRYEQMIRVRFVSPRGSMVSLGEENIEAGDRWWSEVYDGRFGHIYYGHQPYMEASPHIDVHATGLDLGAVFGGYLVAAVLSAGVQAGSSGVKFESVPASGKFAVGLWEGE